eukprot:TRINITY_DN12015_c0_g1_i1.p1 TRINITY_DN12015_c0_g1~~TRINITY_DN12015_c0_g1_i1.p1  ORF type:complete len:719 (+),score=164.00 TRINITY_DN12015_c0_g1_i1:97-2253(+)
MLQGKIESLLIAAPPDGDQLKFQVIEILRYLPDKEFSKRSGETLAEDQNTFDVVLSDGHQTLKCLISPQLNADVNHGRVLPFSIVSIKHHVLRFDETVVGKPPFVIIKQWEAANHAQESIIKARNVQELTPYGGDAAAAALNVPLVSSRGYYLPLYNDDCVHWPASASIDMDPAFRVPAGQQTLKQALNSYQRQKKDYLPVVGRIIRKSRLLHYGQPLDTHKYPFQFYFTIADASGDSSVVVWNSSCVQYFNQLRVGDIVHISNYRLQTSQLEQSKLEISVNPQNPTSIVKKLTEAQSAGFKLPSLSYRFVVSRFVPHLPDKVQFDFVGVIGEVGRRERETITGRLYRFNEYRLLKLRDEGSETPLVVKAYTNSQEDVFNDLQLGEVIVLTNLEITSITHDSTERHVLIRSSTHTQMFVGDALPQHPRVEAVVQWMQADGAAGAVTLMKDLSVDADAHGFHRPLLMQFQSLQHYERAFPKVSLVPADQIRDLSSSVLHRQRVSVLLQGTIEEIVLPPAIQQQRGAPPAKRGKAKTVPPVSVPEQAKKSTRRGKSATADEAGPADALPAAAETIIVAPAAPSDAAFKISIAGLNRDITLRATIASVRLTQYAIDVAAQQQQRATGGQRGRKRKAAAPATVPLPTIPQVLGELVSVFPPGCIAEKQQHALTAPDANAALALQLVTKHLQGRRFIFAVDLFGGDRGVEIEVNAVFNPPASS